MGDGPQEIGDVIARIRRDEATAERMRWRLDRAEHELERARGHLSSFDRRIEGLEAGIERMRARLSGIEASKGWRAINALGRARARVMRRPPEPPSPHPAIERPPAPQPPQPRLRPAGVFDIDVPAGFHAGFEAWLERASKADGGRAVVMFSGVPKMTPTRGDRPSKLARVYAADGDPVFLNYHRTDMTDELPTNDGLIFQSPIDLTPALLDRVLDHSFPQPSRLFFACYPEHLMVRTLFRAEQAGWTTIYDVLDDWEEFARVGAATWYAPSFETYVARTAKVVTAVAPVLAEKIAGIRGAEDVAVVPNGLDPSFPRPGKRAPTRPPILGYFGQLTPRWFDWETVIAGAHAHPQLRFELIGHFAPPGLEVPSNVTVFDGKDAGELAGMSARWSAALIPFRHGALTEAVDPIKVYEYLHLGLPVLTAAIPHLRDYPGVTVASSPESFIEQLPAIVATRLDRARADGWLAQQTWERRIDAYDRLAMDATEAAQ